MIVKVSKGPGRWEFLTDVRNVDCDSTARLATSQTEFEVHLAALTAQANGSPVRNLISEIDWDREIRPRRFGSLVLEYRDHNKEHVLFDGPVYLCNDEGETVEKVVLR